jgi:ammonium transporter, Amt family
MRNLIFDIQSISRNHVDNKSSFSLGVAALAIVNTNIAAAASMTAWILLDVIHAKIRGHAVVFVSIPGVCSATVVGLVVITPGAAYVQPGYAILMGLLGGVVIYSFLLGKKRFFHIDDTLDVFSCHGLGGLIGTLLTGLFSQLDVNDKGRNGAFYGNPRQLGYQLLGALVTCTYSAICTAIILLPMHYTIGIRINRLDQARGLDNVAHGVVDIEETQRANQMKLKTMKQKPADANGTPVTVINVT